MEPKPIPLSEKLALPCRGIFVCDLPSGLTELELMQLFSQYGEIVALQQADTPPDEAIMIEYTTFEAAREAVSIINLSCIRGKIVRCMAISALEVIRSTLVSGQRLLIESIDPAVGMHGLWDVCSLFGQVLDCKLELNPEGKSCGFAFVHYATEEQAKSALENLNGMQIGESEVQLRPFRWDHSARFTGVAYARLMYNPYVESSGAYVESSGVQL